MVWLKADGYKCLWIRQWNFSWALLKIWPLTSKAWIFRVGNLNIKQCGLHSSLHFKLCMQTFWPFHSFRVKKLDLTRRCNKSLMVWHIWPRLNLAPLFFQFHGDIHFYFSSAKLHIQWKITREVLIMALANSNHKILLRFQNWSKDKPCFW